MNYVSTGRLPTDRHLSLIPQMEQQVSTNLNKRNVLFLKPEDVTTRNGEVFTPNLMTLSKLRRSEQFKKDVMFSDNMSGNDVRCRLEEAFPELIHKRFSCAARENNNSSRLLFHGDRRIWDGITMRRKLRGASAMYIVLEDEISQVPASTVTSGGTTGAAVSGNNNYQYNPVDTATVTDAFPPDLKDVNPGRFEMDWKDVMDVLEEDVKKSEQVGSHRSETSQITPQFAVIQEHNKLYQVPSAAAQGSERYDPGYVSSADGSSQRDQELYQGTAVTNDNKRKHSELYQGPAAASRTSQRSQTSFSSEEGSSSQEQELDREAAAAIFPKSGPVKGGTPFSLNNLQVDGSVTFLLATFGTKQVGVTKEHGGNSWLGRTPPGEKPGEVTVAVVAKETGAYLGNAIFTYEPEDETKTANKQSVSSKRELETYSSLDLLGELTRRIKQAKKDYYSDENGILNSPQQQGMPNRAKLLQQQDILKSLVYVAAETGARELIEELCSLSAGKIVFEAYKNECPLPENFVEDNDHKEIAAFSKGITKRYSEEDSTSPSQPEDVDWLVLAKAFEEINLIQSDPSSDQDLRQISEDNILETGYSGDGETSSSNSARDSCDSDDEYEVCKGSSENDVERLREDDVLRSVNIGGAEKSYSDSENERDDSEDQFQAKFNQELNEQYMRKTGHFRYLGSVADCNSGDNNSGEEEKEGETQHGNESYLEGESCCTGSDRPSCDSLELPGNNLEEKMQRTSHQEMLERKTGHLEGKDLQFMGGGADCNSEYSNTEERKKEDKLQHEYEPFLEGECCYASVEGPPCDSLESLRHADSDDKIQGKPHQEMEFENFLDTVRFMIETGQYIQKINEKLDNLKKMEQDFQDVQKYNEDQTIENARYSNYIPIKCYTDALSKAVSEMKRMESKLPKSLQPKVEEIRRYFKSMEEKIEEIDWVVEEIGTKIKEFKVRKYKITEEEKIEMELLMLDLEGDYAIVENYHKAAEIVLQSLNSDVIAYLLKEGVLAAAAAAMVGGAGVAAGTGRSTPPYAEDTLMEQDDPNASHGRGRDPYNQQLQAQEQAQLQRLRTLQASEQMLYGIYEHTMGMIEELEKHEEHGKSVGNSGLLNHLPAYRNKSSREAKKPKDDVEAIIEAELVSLEAQMMFAPPEAKQRAKEKMLYRTKMWAAAREERGIPRGRVDQYACNVVDILNGEPMSLPQRKKGPALDERTANDFMYKLGQARHQGELQDKEFHDDPKKKAVLRKMRQGEDERNGMRRLNNPCTQDMR